jgi:hypothetical protein
VAGVINVGSVAPVIFMTGVSLCVLSVPAVTIVTLMIMSSVRVLFFSLFALLKTSSQIPTNKASDERCRPGL